MRIEADRADARSLVMRYGWNTMAYQILNPGISLWFPAERDAVVGYVRTRTHCIVAGSPVAAADRLDAVTAEFIRSVRSERRAVCFFGAQERIAEILQHTATVSAILLGAQPVWSPESLLRTMRTKRSLRAQLHRAENKSVTVEVWNNRSSLPEQALRTCLQEWIDTRHLPPMHFLVEPETLGHLEDRVLMTAVQNGRLTAFCIASPIPLRNGWLIEQIIRGRNTPNGTAELLLQHMTQQLQKQGASLITLGLSPLSRNTPAPQNDPLWLRLLLRATRSYGRTFYNFEGLDAFKAKFQPDAWEPVYAVTNESAPSPATLYAIAAAFTVRSPLRFILTGIRKRFALSPWH